MNLDVDNNSTNDFQIIDGANNTRFLVQGSGNVGIGTTSPVYTLDVDVAASGTEIARFNSGSTGSNGGFIGINTNHVQRGILGGGGINVLTGSAVTDFVVRSEGQLLFATNGNTRQVTIDTSGNVGIGTTAPSSTLHLRSTAAANDSPKLLLESEVAGRYFPSVVFKASTTGGTSYEIGKIKAGFDGDNTWAKTKMIFQVPVGGAALANVMTLNYGNVGIGTTAPVQQLELTKSLRLVDTIDSTTGVIYKGANRFLHNYAATGSDGMNLFLGVSAGNFTMDDVGATAEASYNTGVGTSVLSANSTGYANVGLGSQALLSNTIGYYNMAVGMSSLRNNTEGYANVAVGRGAAGSNTTGSKNISIGESSLNFTKTGEKNTAIGWQAGYGVSNNSFSNNSLFGYRTGASLTMGSNNLLLGYQAGDNLTTGANNIAIGYDIDMPDVASANMLNIGNLLFATGIDGTGTALSSGNVGIGTTNPSQKLHVLRTDAGSPVRFQDSNAYCEVNPTTASWSCTSDNELKTDIASLSGSSMLNKITSLQGINFRWKTQTDNTLRYGFIAQDVEKIFPEFVSTDENGLKSVAYGAFTPVLVEAIKAQQKEIDGLKLVLSPAGAISNASSTLALAEGSGLSDWLVKGLNSLGVALKGGVASLAEVIAVKFTGQEANIKNINTDRICINNSEGKAICLSGDQLEDLIDKAGSSATTVKAGPISSGYPAGSVVPGDSLVTDEAGLPADDMIGAGAKDAGTATSTTP